MADLTAIAGIGIPTTGILAVIGYMGWQIRGKQDKGTCEVNHKYIEDELKEGSKKFNKLNETLIAQGQMLARIDERVAHIARKNGYKEK